MAQRLNDAASSRKSPGFESGSLPVSFVCPLQNNHSVSSRTPNTFILVSFETLHLTLVRTCPCSLYILPLEAGRLCCTHYRAGRETGQLRPDFIFQLIRYSLHQPQYLPVQLMVAEMLLQSSEFLHGWINLWESSGSNVSLVRINSVDKLLLFKCSFSTCVPSSWGGSVSVCFHIIVSSHLQIEICSICIINPTQLNDFCILL